MTDDVTRHRRRPGGWWRLAAFAALYAAGAVFARLLGDHLTDVTLLTYAVAEVGGAAFLLRYMRTDWREHAWGRHVMAFTACLEVLFTLTLSRRIFGTWPGLAEVGFLASVTLAVIVWWRYRLLIRGSRPGR